MWTGPPWTGPVRGTGPDRQNTGPPQKYQYRTGPTLLDRGTGGPALNFTQTPDVSRGCILLISYGKV